MRSRLAVQTKRHKAAKDRSTGRVEDEPFGVAHNVCAAHADCMHGITHHVDTVVVVSVPSHSLVVLTRSLERNVDRTPHVVSTGV